MTNLLLNTCPVIELVLHYGNHSTCLHTNVSTLYSLHYIVIDVKYFSLVTLAQVLRMICSRGLISTVTLWLFCRQAGSAKVRRKESGSLLIDPPFPQCQKWEKRHQLKTFPSQPEARPVWSDRCLSVVDSRKIKTMTYYGLKGS